MAKELKEGLAAFAAVAFLVGFAAVVYLAARHSFADAPPSWATADPFVYIGTLLAGLVGGVTAVTFGQDLPDPAKVTLLPRAAHILGKTVDVRAIVVSGYAIAYFLGGVVAVVVWVWTQGDALDLIKNLASVSLGLLVAIARSWLTPTA